MPYTECRFAVLRSAASGLCLAAGGTLGVAWYLKPAAEVPAVVSEIDKSSMSPEAGPRLESAQVNMTLADPEWREPLPNDLETCVDVLEAALSSGTVETTAPHS